MTTKRPNKVANAGEMFLVPLRRFTSLGPAWNNSRRTAHHAKL